MLTALFIILMFAVFGKLIRLLSRHLGDLKSFTYDHYLPVVLIGLFVSGLVYIALYCL